MCLVSGSEGSEEGQGPDEEEVRAAAGRLHYQSSGGSQEGRGVPYSQSGGSLTGGTPPVRLSGEEGKAVVEKLVWGQTGTELTPRLQKKNPLTCDTVEASSVHVAFKKRRMSLTSRTFIFPSSPPPPLLLPGVCRCPAHVICPGCSAWFLNASQHAVSTTGT